MRRIDRTTTIEVEYGNRLYIRTVRRGRVLSLLRGLMADVNVCAQELRADIVTEPKFKLKRRKRC